MNQDNQLKINQSLKNPTLSLIRKDYTRQYSRRLPLGGLLFFMEAAMQTRNKGQEVCWEHTEIEVQAKEWQKRAIQKDARRFEQIVTEMRQKLGLEVSHG